MDILGVGWGLETVDQDFQKLEKLGKTNRGTDFTVGVKFSGSGNHRFWCTFSWDRTPFLNRFWHVDVDDPHAGCWRLDCWIPWVLWPNISGFEHVVSHGIRYHQFPMKKTSTWGVYFDFRHPLFLEEPTATQEVTTPVAMPANLCFFLRPVPYWRGGSKEHTINPNAQNVQNLRSKLARKSLRDQL